MRHGSVESVAIRKPRTMLKMSEGVKLCPRCGEPMIEEGTPVSRAWVCLVCGATFVEPKQGGDDQ